MNFRLNGKRNVVIQDGDRKTAKQREKGKTFNESEEYFRALFERSLDCVYIHDFDGNIIDINPATLTLLGYKKEEAASLNLKSLIDRKQTANATKVIDRIIQTGFQMELTEYKLNCKNGKQVDVETKASLICRDGKPYAVLGIARDITERKKAERSLREHKNDLKKKTHLLEEANTALNVLIKHREEEINDIEQNIIINIREMIVPHIEKLKLITIESRHNDCLSAIESNLEKITSSFMKQMKSQYLNLTSQELQIANLIREGRNTKAIAEKMSISQRTVECYRYRIRAKVGINNKKSNLKTYLLSHQ